LALVVLVFGPGWLGLGCLFVFGPGCLFVLGPRCLFVFGPRWLGPGWLGPRCFCVWPSLFLCLALVVFV